MASPGARIILLDGDKELAQNRADANSEWVIVTQHPPLSTGAHELRVTQHFDGRAPVTSDQVVLAVVPRTRNSPVQRRALIVASET